MINEMERAFDIKRRYDNGENVSEEEQKWYNKYQEQRCIEFMMGGCPDNEYEELDGKVVYILAPMFGYGFYNSEWGDI